MPPTGPRDGSDIVLVGDLNIAPREHDVWSHKQLLKVVSHTPVETEALDRCATPASSSMSPAR
jgi:exonuclease III